METRVFCEPQEMSEGYPGEKQKKGETKTFRTEITILINNVEDIG